MKHFFQIIFALLVLSGCQYTNQICTNIKADSGIEGIYRVVSYDLADFKLNEGTSTVTRTDKGTYDFGTSTFYTCQINGQWILEGYNEKESTFTAMRLEWEGNRVGMIPLVFDKDELDRESIPYSISRRAPLATEMFLPTLKDGLIDMLLVDNSKVNSDKMGKVMHPLQMKIWFEKIK